MSWEPRNLAALPDSDPPEADLSGVGYRGGKRHLLIGATEALKTWTAYVLGLEDIRRGGVVLHVDLEMSPAETRRRLVAMGATDDELRRWAYVEPERPPKEGELDSLIRCHAPTLAIVDAAAGAFDLLSLDDNARRDAEVFARRLIAPFHRSGVSTLVVDHVTKNVDARGKWAIGSERKTGSADVVLGAKAVTPFARGRTGVVSLSVFKDRFGALPRPHAAELELRSDPLTHAVTWAFRPAVGEQTNTDVWRPTVLMERVSRYLEQQQSAVTRSDIYRDVKGKRDYLITAVDSLVGDGWANEEFGERRSCLIRSIKPFRDSSPVVPESSPAHHSPVVPTVPSPSRGDGDGNHNRDHVEAERLLEAHADIAAGIA